MDSQAGDGGMRRELRFQRGEKDLDDNAAKYFTEYLGWQDGFRHDAAVNFPVEL